MKDLNYYQDLPEKVSIEQIEQEFGELLSVTPSADSLKAYISSIYELSDRQWHQYQILNHNLREQVSHRLVTLWKDNDVEVADTILGITGMLGLPIVMDFVSSRPVESFSPDVRMSVRGAFDEFGSTISDPYSGM